MNQESKKFSNQKITQKQVFQPPTRLIRATTHLIVLIIGLTSSKNAQKLESTNGPISGRFGGGNDLKTSNHPNGDKDAKVWIDLSTWDKRLTFQKKYVDFIDVQHSLKVRSIIFWFLDVNGAL